MPATLTLNKFELLWYLESVVRGSHLRWGGYEDMVNTVWLQLSDSECEVIYTYAKRDLLGIVRGGSSEEHLMQVLARYNPSNQYNVRVKNGDGYETIKGAYLYKGHYYVNWYKYIADELVACAERVPFRTCGFDSCPFAKECRRHFFRGTFGAQEVELQASEVPVFSGTKCDFFLDMDGDGEINASGDEKIGRAPTCTADCTQCAQKG